MLYKSKQIKGQGRGHKIGFPTINLQISDDFHLDDGIYATWVEIGYRTFKGALHYGSVPTFDEKEKKLEVFLLDIDDSNAPDTKSADIEIDVVQKLRDVKNFESAEELAIQIEKDVSMVRSILK